MERILNLQTLDLIGVPHEQMPGLLSSASGVCSDTSYVGCVSVGDAFDEG
jgi:hypothetical protein